MGLGLSAAKGPRSPYGAKGARGGAHLDRFFESLVTLKLQSIRRMTTNDNNDILKQDMTRLFLLGLGTWGLEAPCDPISNNKHIIISSCNKLYYKLLFVSISKLYTVWVCAKLLRMEFTQFRLVFQ